MHQISEGDLNYLELTAKYSPNDLAKPENTSKILGLLAEINAATTYQETIEHLEEEVNRLEDELLDAKQEYQDLQGEMEALREEINALG